MQSVMRNYLEIWKQFILQDAINDGILPPALLQSWRRCAAYKIDPYTFGTTSASTVAIESVPHELLLLLRPSMEDLHQFAEGAECVVVFANTNATIIDIVGDRLMQQELKRLDLSIGSSWSEDKRGSNALALALQESFPIQLDGPMHYCAPLHRFYTSAAPVHDLFGQTVGVLGVIGHHGQCHPHTLGMISAAAQAISNQLQMQVWLSNANNLLSELKTILQTLSEGILLLSRDGIVSQMNTPAGTMLGLQPERVTGRHLRDVLPLPQVLAQALAFHQPLSYEELVFETHQGRVACLCTLKPISNAQSETGIETIVNSANLIMPEPVTTDGFVLILRSIERVQKLVHRMTGAHARLTFANVVGESPAIKEALRRARLAAGSNSTVLLHGETGTGKEIFAQSIHNAGSRASGPFVAINCAAIPRELITTELFGYEGGAFTGADRQGRPGKFEQAHGGTLFLDEIGDMPLDLQASLLRAIETRTIVRLGGQRVIAVDVRIIAASHRDLHAEALQGNFRSDLYYRLNVLTIEIPALRERREDIPLLVHYFLQRQSRILGHSLSISDDALAQLSSYYWPGNIRELENTLERASYLTTKEMITVDDLPMTHPAPSLVPPRRIQEATQHNSVPAPSKQPLKEQHKQAEAEAILAAWQQCNGNVTLTASQLGISRTTLWRKMQKYGIANMNHPHSKKES
jgi:PAS domain S-box-containing protein